MSSNISRKTMATTDAYAGRLFLQLGLVIAALLFLIGIANGFTSNVRSDETLEAEVANLTLVTGSRQVVEESEPVTETLPPHMQAEVPDVTLATGSRQVIGEVERVTETLTPRMRAVLEYVTHRYRVSPDALGPIFEAAERIGFERRLDPLLIVAIIGVESSFNPFAESSAGAQGLMQVIPRFHLSKVPEGVGIKPLFDPVINVQVGAQVLDEAIRLRGGLMAGLRQFAGAVDDEEQAYAAKVLAEKQRLEQATRRKGLASG